MTRRAFLSFAVAAAAQERAVQTVTGPVAASSLGLTLMHEHVVTDLRDLADRRPEDYDREDAIAVSLPHLAELREAGAATLVEPTPLHIGRDLEALRALSLRTSLRIVGSTGIYGAAEQRFIPDYARKETAERLAERYLREITDGVGPDRVRPGLIKTGVNKGAPLPEIERKLVRAAALAGAQSGLTVASHTGPAAPALEELGIIQAAGLAPERFIWVHAHNERDHALHHRLAKEGVWVEFDGLSERSADWHLACLRSMAEAGLLGKALLSQDAGWYRPGAERGSRYRGYTYLLETFAPRLLRQGFSQAELHQLLIKNPARALAG
ncbi:MAG: phosphotriesterase [Acidobacteria bacterium]|nr:phosphotriesterase [Acidobacteriota bacterium]